MADSSQTCELHTIIRSKDAPRDDTVFYSIRLVRLLLEAGLGFLLFQRQRIIKSTIGTYHGVVFVAGFSAVSLLPVCVTMETRFLAVCNTVRIGKMVTCKDGQGVIYEILPDDISRRYIFILAPVHLTGRAYEKATGRLIKKGAGCGKDRIVVLSIAVVPQAVVRICSRFFRIEPVVSAIDNCLDDNRQVFPGIGDFATRYFGTD